MSLPDDWYHCQRTIFNYLKLPYGVFAMLFDPILLFWTVMIILNGIIKFQLPRMITLLFPSSSLTALNVRVANDRLTTWFTVLFERPNGLLHRLTTKLIGWPIQNLPTKTPETDCTHKYSLFSIHPRTYSEHTDPCPTLSNFKNNVSN